MHTCSHLPIHTAQISSVTFSFSLSPLITHTQSFSHAHTALLVLVSPWWRNVFTAVKLLLCGNTAKVHRCKSSHEHRGPSAQRAEARGRASSQNELKMEMRLEHGLEIGLRKELRLSSVFYNCVQGSGLGINQECACGLEEVLKLCLEQTITYCNTGALPFVGLGTQLGCLESY